jgi:cyclic pyranopterin phosphate synthase
MTADGKMVTCLFSQAGHDLKTLLRSGVSDEDILKVLSSIWRKRDDRYSDERLSALRSSKYDPRSHKKIEMISLGG